MAVSFSILSKTKDRIPCAVWRVERNREVQNRGDFILLFVRQTEFRGRLHAQRRSLVEVAFEGSRSVHLRCPVSLADLSRQRMEGKAKG